MKTELVCGRRWCAALMAAGLLLGLPGLHGAQPNKNNKNNGKHGTPTATATTYGGQAIALRIDGVTQPVSGPIIVCDTGMLPSSGGTIDKAESNVNIADGGLTIQQASATVSGVGPEASAESTLTGYRVEFVVTDGGHTHRALIEADYIHADVSAAVSRKGEISTAANVIITNLRVNGEVITVTGAPNQRVDLPHEVGGYLVLNEQSSINGNGSGDVGVAAIHFFVCHCIEGQIGFVHAGITPGNTPPAEEHDCGKVTGGGWITGTPGGGKGTFGVSGGIRRGEFWGHLTYIDHDTGMKVKSTAVTGFEIEAGNKDSYFITYNVEINGAAGTARVHVVDKGEPGRNDIFEIALSNGYRAGGDLGGARSGGGNIQAHKCPPGWE